MKIKDQITIQGARGYQAEQHDCSSVIQGGGTEHRSVVNMIDWLLHNGEWQVVCRHQFDRLAVHCRC